MKIEVPAELAREPTEDEATEKSGNWAGGNIEILYSNPHKLVFFAGEREKTSKFAFALIFRKKIFSLKER